MNIQPQGCLVVAGALNCQLKATKTIIENGGDYLLSVKDNHPDLKADIADYVDDEQLKSTMEQAAQIEKSRERIERRNMLQQI